MILFVILAILLIAQVITYFLNREKIKKINEHNVKGKSTIIIKNILLIISLTLAKLITILKS